MHDRLPRWSAPGSDRRVGLELSNSHARAVEVHGSGRAARPVRWGAVDLEPGTVVDGTVRDSDSLTAALRALWAEAGLRTRNVVVGLGVHDTAVRTLQLPVLSPRDLRSAIRFELADTIPFPVDEARTDAIEVDRDPATAERPEIRMLAVAAHQPSIAPLLHALRAAGLRPQAVDIPALAAIRAVATVRSDPGTTAVAALGDDTLSVVVHRNGLPMFARELTTSTTDMDARLSGVLEDELSLIDRHRGGVSPGAVRSDPLAEAVRATLEYHSVLDPDTAIERLVLLGPADRTSLLAQRLATDLSCPIVAVSPLATAGAAEAPDGTAEQCAVAYGLAIRSRRVEDGPRWLHLMPNRASAAGRMSVVGLAALSAAAGLVLVLMATLLLGPDPGEATADADRAQAQLDTISAELASSQSARDGAAEVTRRSNAREAVRADSVDWDRIIAAIATVPPAGTTILSVDARRAEEAGDEVGSVEVTVEAPGQEAINGWLEHLGSIPGLADPWLGDATTSGRDPSTASTIFTVRADLTSDAFEDASGGTGAP